MFNFCFVCQYQSSNLLWRLPPLDWYWQTRQYRKMHKLNITENSKQGKNSKRKLPVPWFSLFLRHSARKPDGLILQCNRHRTGLYNQKKQFVWGTVLLHLLLCFSLRYIILVSCYNITVVVICNTYCNMKSHVWIVCPSCNVLVLCYTCYMSSRKMDVCLLNILWDPSS